MKRITFTLHLVTAAAWLGCSGAESQTSPDGDDAQRDDVGTVGDAGSGSADDRDASTAPDAAAQPTLLQVSAPVPTTTSELGATASFEVRLLRAPAQTVTVPIVSDDPSEGVASPAELVFTADDWDQPRAITVTGQPDDELDGDVDYTISVGPSRSDDTELHGLTSEPVRLTNQEHPLPAYRDYSINHVLSTGQSNSVANSSHEILSTSQPFTNLMFDVGVMTAKNCNGNGCLEYETPQSLVPLVEGDVFPLNATPRETMSSGMGNQIAELATRMYFTDTPYEKHDVLVSLHGRSGNAYFCLRFGGCNWWTQDFIKPFDEGMRQVRDAKRLADAAGRSYVVRAVTTIHGENDHYSPHFPYAVSQGEGRIENYADALIEWQVDYEREARAITGQPEPVPLFVMQMQGYTDYPAAGYSAIAADQLRAHERAPGKVVLVAPAYMLEFRPDCLHYTSASQRRMGEYFGKAYAQTIFRGQPWQPLRPLTIARQGRELRVRYHVPVPPLVLDTETVSNPGNYGFQFVDDGNTAQVSEVRVQGDEVVITLSADPSGANPVLRYAVQPPQSPAGSYCPGPSRGSRGNLRDSDATPSLSGGAPLVNWSAGFQLPVP